MRTVRSLSMAVALLCTVAVARPAVAQDCQLPNILVLFDVSGSMAGTKYNQAVSGINAFMNSYQDRAQFGLGVFPRPNEGTSSFGYCSIKTDGTGALINAVPFATANRAPFNTYLNSFGGPKSTYDTPIYQALTASSLSPGLTDPSRRTYVLLISDGQQDCCRNNDYDNDADCKSLNPNVFDPTETQENRDDIRNLVALLKARANPLTTYAIGFGGGVDALTLNYVAAAAGTQRIAGCNEAGTDPAATNNCYYKANDSAALSAALGAIVQQINQEVCDNQDNDCNGIIDDGVPSSGSCGIETGECVAGALQCSAGEWNCIGSTGPSTEICDNKDNDCDGQIDDGVPSAGACGTDEGQCSVGQQQCAAGKWNCVGSVGPSSEVCNLLDDNCDGTPDNGILCDCAQGDHRACGMTNTGECALGQQQCVADGNGGWTWGACDAIYPVGEICDGKDNNCNHITDEGTDEACMTQCGPGIKACIDGKLGACVALNPPAEVCDGEDNDCDGDVDENMDQVCQTACGTGIKKCVAGQYGQCVPLATPEEICDGQDNDCDGQVDEGCPCKQGETRPCGQNVAQCTQGVEICEFGEWSQCQGGNNGQGEVCDGIDNDCNGIVDDGENICPTGQICLCGGCRPSCASDNTCSNGGSCVLGICQKDNCPSGQMCSDGKCVAGEPIGTLTEPPEVQDKPRTDLNDKRGLIKGGCGCREAQAGDAAIFALLAVALFFRRRA